MRARKLDRRVTIKSVTEMQSASGALVPTYTTVAEVAAEQRPVRGFEQTEGARDQARGEKVFRIRWRAGVTNKHVLVDEGGVTYDITRIDEVTGQGHRRREGLDITAIAKVS